MSNYERSVPEPTPIYRELYHKHGLGRLLDEAYVDEWDKARRARRDGSVSWAAVVGIAAMLDMDPRTIMSIQMEPHEVTVEHATFDSQGKFAGVATTARPIEQPKKL